MSGETAQTEKPKKVAIVGFAPTWPHAPFDDESFEIWACNEFHLLNKRISVLFELHSHHEIEQKEKNLAGRGRHLEWMQREAKIPIMMCKKFEDIPTAVAYPKDHIVERFGTYFTNTISWQIALAIDLGFQEIQLWGVNMANDEEYASQRPSCEYFIGLARGMGIKVTIPDESDLCKSWTLYGFDDEISSVIHKRLKHLEDEKKEQRQQFEAMAQQNIAQMHQAIGWVGALEMTQKNFLYANTSLSELFKELPKEKAS